MVYYTFYTVYNQTILNNRWLQPYLNRVLLCTFLTQVDQPAAVLINDCFLPAVFWVTRRALSVTSCNSASKTTASAAQTEWSAWLSFSSKTSRGRAAACAGVIWANASRWTTRASPPCASSPSAPVTTWPRSL